MRLTIISRINVPGPQPYKPPKGFQPAKKQSPPSSNASSLLSDLRGKQVIHITAPSHLPLSKVNEISMSKIMKGEPILGYEGKSYGIPAESFDDDQADGKTLLVFDQKTQTYINKADRVPSYHVQEMIHVPQADKAAVEALRDTVKPARPQPKGLKMRFRPIGSLPAAPQTLGSDSESDAEPSKAPAGERKERKRKHHHTDDATQAAAVDPKRSRRNTHKKTMRTSLAIRSRRSPTRTTSAKSPKSINGCRGFIREKISLLLRHAGQLQLYNFTTSNRSQLYMT
jgi:DNA-directed RNA polymerase I subunit RPA34.